MTAWRRLFHSGSGATMLLTAYVILFLVFILLPIAAVIVVSFSSASYIAFPLPGFSVAWYAKMAANHDFTSSLTTSIELALVSACIGALLGCPAALALARSRGVGAGLLANLLLAPISVPAIVLGFSLLYFLSALSFGLSFGALLVAHSVVAIPYIVRTVLATYRAVSTNLEESASVLGASRWQVLWHVTLPMVRPGIFAGAMFAVLTSLDNLPLSFFFGTATVNTLPVVMLNYMQNNFDPSIAAISVVQMLIAVATLLVLDRVYGIERLTAA
ncbi:MAG TPA: ABC transporter permease [Rhodopila sp.]|uniref:ABC transporter permease n=1 Tax=Rhodopila sp. TaxID=2480087 RepID=UPI002C74CA68|nr:ABC transporter permease [Rhodopila sp.]HVY15013.1 ABC transporter permease [Rhodopila sp.]